MNIRLVLCSAPASMRERYGSLAAVGSTEPSFGLVCLAAAAEQGGATVHIVEASAENLSIEQAAREALRHNPDVVGISATTSGIASAGELANLLKAANKRLVVLVGGCHATALPEQTLQEFKSFDLVVVGEGEETLKRILIAVASDGRVPQGIEGTVQREGNGTMRNPPRAFISDLDQLPLPAWSLLRGFPRAYHPSPARIRRWPCASVVLTRGCPNVCTFCDRSVFGRSCRSYSPSYAVKLIRDLRKNYGVKEVLIEDDTFVIIKDRVRDFCERLLSEQVNVSWSCLGRADRMDPYLLMLMRKAGCWQISYGIESGVSSILEAVHKNIDLEQVRRALSWTREAGIRTKGFFMVGFPGETLETLETTRQFALSLPLDDISVMQLTPFPGSELYREAARLGAFDCDWRKMNTLNSVFVPEGLTRDDLDIARDSLLRSFYLRPRVLATHAVEAIRRPRLLVHLARGAKALFRVAGNSHEQ